MNLTVNDLNILIEALDAWVDKDAAGEMFLSIVSHTLAGGDPRARTEAERERAYLRRQGEAARRSREEVATLLKATLIRMRRDLESREAEAGP